MFALKYLRTIVPMKTENLNILTVRRFTRRPLWA